MRTQRDVLFARLLAAVVKENGSKKQKEKGESTFLKEMQMPGSFFFAEPNLSPLEHFKVITSEYAHPIHILKAA